MIPNPISKRPNLIEQYRAKMNNFLPPKTDSYSVGNRVYNGGSPSPHAGAGGLNPVGYQNRDQLANAARKNALADYVRKMRN